MDNHEVHSLFDDPSVQEAYDAWQQGQADHDAGIAARDEAMARAEGGAVSFWARVDKCESGCWEWTGWKNSKGYGKWTSAAPNRRTRFCHRYAWELLVGPIPEGASLCHHCDNPSCVNPEHLYVGNATTNAIDRERRGRGKGNRLSEEAVRRIRELADAGYSKIGIARELGHSQHTVHAYLTGNCRWDRKFTTFDPSEVAK